MEDVFLAGFPRALGVAVTFVEILVNITGAGRLIERSRIVLLAATGCGNKQIAAELHITPEKAARWRKRYLQLGLAGLEKDAPRPGRKPRITAKLVRELIRKTTQQTPPNATHWSTRSMAAARGISEASVRRIWHAHGLKPHRTATFKLSNDPRLAEKLEDVVGLYLNPPEHALVLSVDEKSQMQALDRTQPGLPLKKGRAGTRTHDYKRYGTTTLFAALNTLDGKLISTCMKKHRHHEWLKFLRLIDRRTAPDKPLHLIVDNYATHKHEKVQRWLARHNDSTSTSPRPVLRGSIGSRDSSAISRRTACAEGRSVVWMNLSRPSTPISTHTTTTPNLTSGPLPPPISWRKSNALGAL